MEKRYKLVDFDVTEDFLKQFIEFSEKYAVWYNIRFEKRVNKNNRIQPFKYDLVVWLDRYSYIMKNNYLIDFNDFKIEFDKIMWALMFQMEKRARKKKQKLKNLEDIFANQNPDRMQDLNMGLRIPFEPPSKWQNLWIAVRNSRWRFSKEQKSKMIEILYRRNFLLKRENSYLMSVVRRKKKELFDLTYHIGKRWKRARNKGPTA